jgi:hypothetical protein
MNTGRIINKEDKFSEQAKPAATPISRWALPYSLIIDHWSLIIDHWIKYTKEVFILM